jgi:hypothetical protein
VGSRAGLPLPRAETMILQAASQQQAISLTVPFYVHQWHNIWL